MWTQDSIARIKVETLRPLRTKLSEVNETRRVLRTHSSETTYDDKGSPDVYRFMDRYGPCLHALYQLCNIPVTH